MKPQGTLSHFRVTSKDLLMLARIPVLCVSDRGLKLQWQMEDPLICLLTRDRDSAV